MNHEVDNELGASTHLQTATPLQTKQAEDCQKRIQILESPPPTPAKDQVIKYLVEQQGIASLAAYTTYPQRSLGDYNSQIFFWDNCKAYIEALLHGSYRY
jgi:hypothetical protein